MVVRKKHGKKVRLESKNFVLKMKVTIDISPVKNAHQWRGIGIYTQKLVEALKRIGEKDFELVLTENGRIPSDVDLIHYPYFDLFFPTLPIFKKKKTLVTIHDVIPLVFPQAYPPGVKGKIRFLHQKISLKGVRAIITDSFTSKRDISKYLNFPPNSIHVVYLAPAAAFQQIKEPKLLEETKKKFNLPKEFVLYVGDIAYHKNVSALASVCRKLKIPLVVVGKQAAGEEFDRNHIENQPLVDFLKNYGDDPRVYRLGFVPEEDLVRIYNLATVYCQPSLYEGFGLPVLEAMVCGCPVISSQTSSLSEIAAEAALFFNPESHDQLILCLKDILKNDKLKARMIERGLQQSKKFSWEKTAQKTFAVYAEVVKKI